MRQDSDIIITNNSSEVKNISIEPWCEIHSIAPNCSVTIEVSDIAGSKKTLNLTLDEDNIAIHLWEGSNFEIRKE